MKELAELLKQKHDAERKASGQQESTGGDVSKYMGMAKNMTSGLKMPKFSRPKF